MTLQFLDIYRITRVALVSTVTAIPVVTDTGPTNNAFLPAGICKLVPRILSVIIAPSYNEILPCTCCAPSDLAAPVAVPLIAVVLIPAVLLV